MSSNMEELMDLQAIFHIQSKFDMLRLSMKKFTICFNLQVLMDIILSMLWWMNGKGRLLTGLDGFQWLISINLQTTMCLALRTEQQDQMNLESLLIRQLLFSQSRSFRSQRMLELERLMFLFQSFIWLICLDARF